MKKISRVALLILVIYAGSATAKATTPLDTAQSVFENLIESLRLVSTIKTQGRPIDTITIQTAFNRVLDVSVADIEELQTKLTSLKNLPEVHGVARMAYREQLSEFRVRLDDVRQQINQDVPITDIVAIVQDFRRWHESVYQPVTKPILDFIAVFQNYDAITTAKMRLAIIIKDDKKIRSLLSSQKTNVFSNIIKKAAHAIKLAIILNARAERLLHQETNEYKQPETITIVIDAANENLRTAYDYFITISELLKKK